MSTPPSSTACCSTRVRRGRGHHTEVADLAYHGAGDAELSLTNRGDGPARALLLGGPPFGEELVMWWNFVGRSHDDIVAYRRMWEDKRPGVRSRGRLPRSVAACRLLPCPMPRFGPVPTRRPRSPMTTDKPAPRPLSPPRPTGSPSPSTVRPVGLAEFADRDGQRVFIHTEVADGFEGRGLATILIAEALQATRDAGSADRCRLPDGGGATSTSTMSSTASSTRFQATSSAG